MVTLSYLDSLSHISRIFAYFYRLFWAPTSPHLIKGRFILPTSPYPAPSLLIMAPELKCPGKLQKPHGQKSSLLFSSIKASCTYFSIRQLSEPGLPGVWTYYLDLRQLIASLPGSYPLTAAISSYKKGRPERRGPPAPITFWWRQ